MAIPPKKLKKDAIAEALCEIRFECEESESFPEVVLGRLAEFGQWREFNKTRLAAADIPESIRVQDPSLKTQPVMELAARDHGRMAKIGLNLLSYHRLQPYPGWGVFKPEIDHVVDFLFGAFQSFQATRVGFRYINFLTEEDHGVRTPQDLNFSVNVADETLCTPQNLNYRVEPSEAHSAIVRIASPDFVSSPLKQQIKVFVDVDVFTRSGTAIDSAAAVKDWIEAAHTVEKLEFFRLFTPEMLDRLVEVE